MQEQRVMADYPPNRIFLSRLLDSSREVCFFIASICRNVIKTCIFTNISYIMLCQNKTNDVNHLWQ